MVGVEEGGTRRHFFFFFPGYLFMKRRKMAIRNSRVSDRPFQLRFCGLFGQRKKKNKKIMYMHFLLVNEVWSFRK
jgi:hypothetical protein